MSKQDGTSRRITEVDSGDRSAVILHLDMDAFFASVELLEHPELRDRPVVVGHRGPRSVVSAANYAARRFGVNSAMPMAVALRRCPQAVVLEPHYERYRHYSKQVFAICADFTPLVEPLSVDEAFLDISGALRLFGTPFDIAVALRRRVLAETGLHASVGAAASKFVAKLASGMAKPSGFLQIPAERTRQFLEPLPVTALWGVGPAGAEKLRRLGIGTMKQLLETPIELLAASLGRAGAEQLRALAQGRDERAVVTERVEKSISHEVTYEADVADTEQLERELLRLAEQVGRRLRAKRLAAGTVTVKLRFGDFNTISRSRTLALASDVGRELAETARELFRESGVYGTPIRLIGVGAGQLRGADESAPPLWDEQQHWRELDRLRDSAAERFGSAAPRPASLLGPAVPRISPGPAPPLE